MAANFIGNSTTIQELFKGVSDQFTVKIWMNLNSPKLNRTWEATNWEAAAKEGGEFCEEDEEAYLINE